MTDPYIINSESWCRSLRRLMGHPDHVPVGETLAYCASGPRDADGVIHLRQIAADIRRDLVHLTFETDDAAEPSTVSLAIRRDDNVEWQPNCALYAASETARIELLAADRRWFIGPRNVLTSAKLPPTSRREKGAEIAMRRLQQAVANSGPLGQVKSVWVPSGERFDAAVPSGQLNVAV